VTRTENVFTLDPLFEHVSEIPVEELGRRWPVVTASARRFPLLPGAEPEEDDAMARAVAEGKVVAPITQIHRWTPVDTDFLQENRETVPLSSLLRFHRQLIAPDQEVVIVAKYRLNPLEMDSEYGDRGRGPDLRYVHPSGNADRGVGTAAAFQLLTGVSDVEGPVQLAQLAGMAGLSKRGRRDLSHAVHSGVVHAVSAEYVAGLDQQVDLEDYYLDGAYWLAALRLHDVKEIGTTVFPFPPQIEVSDYPDPSFLPYIALSYLSFIRNLSEHVKAGAKYEINSLTPAVSKLYGFVDKVIDAAGNQISADEIQQLLDFFEGMDLEFRRAINVYVRNPSLLVKTEQDGDTGGNTPTYRQMRDDLRRDHLARAPRNLQIGFEVDARKGNI